jgi:RNA polymerase sigma factor (TIGR02999 family)
MSDPNREDLTALLQAWSGGDSRAGDRLLPLVYDELRRQAASYLRHERHEHTLPATALVNEAYLRLVGQHGTWQNRRHFFAVAAQMMRRVLVDHARARGRSKRAGDWIRIPLDAAGEIAVVAATDVEILAVEQAIEELERLEPQHARLVELRFHAGLSVEDTAEVLGVSASTVTREWRLVRAWLYRRLAEVDAPAQAAVRPGEETPR